jgi:hypothetical protein
MPGSQEATLYETFTLHGETKCVLALKTSINLGDHLIVMLGLADECFYDGQRSERREPWEAIVLGSYVR